MHVGLTIIIFNDGYMRQLTDRLQVFGPANETLFEAVTWAMRQVTDIDNSRMRVSIEGPTKEITGI